MPPAEVTGAVAEVAADVTGASAPPRLLVLGPEPEPVPGPEAADVTPVAAEVTGAAAEVTGAAAEVLVPRPVLGPEPEPVPGPEAAEVTVPAAAEVTVPAAEVTGAAAEVVVPARCSDRSRSLCPSPSRWWPRCPSW